MQTIKKTNTDKKLVLLIFIFIFGFVSLITLNNFFSSLSAKLDNETKNLKAKIAIGEFIAYDIVKIRALFHELATTTSNQKSRDRLIGKIDGVLYDIKDSLDVLDHGGVLKRFISLNIVGHLNTVKVVKYQKPSNEKISLESIDIRPKLDELRDKIKIINELLAKRSLYKKNKDFKSFTRTARKIRRYYKTLPAYFTRLSENTRRLLYEGEIELKALQKEIDFEKQKYMKMKIALILTVILIVVIFGYMITKKVAKDSQEIYELNLNLQETLTKQAKQERAIRAILDAQSNIIIVTNGYNMIDANKQLVKFFDQYKDFEDFKNKVECICDFFEKDIPNDEYIAQKEYDGVNWVDYIMLNHQKHFKVIIKKGAKKHHFLIQATKTILDDDTGEAVIIITFNDITVEVNTQLKLASMNKNLELLVANKTKELQELNENLEQKVIIESAKAREKDKQLMQQARFAALGEMIGNIAHQWRQPLSAISSISSGMQLQMELGLTTDEEINNSYKKILNNIEFLSQTIEDFRGFFKEDKENVDFNVVDIINKTVPIIEASYKDNNIILHQEIENDTLISHGMPSELSQVFLNILNNAKDATVSNNPKERNVYLHATCNDKYNIVTIQDNAGGIPLDIIEKIFDPYFTTKHQSQGTGIGLYMSKDIVENHMHGQISVKNISRTIGEYDYDGACFIVKIPKATSHSKL